MAHPGLGDLEQLVLLAVVRLEPSAYAVSVRQEIERRTGRSVSRGAVYVTLERMERKGYLRSRLGQPTAERGGKAKRLFALQPDGRAALETSLRDIQGMLAGLETRLGWDLSA